MPFPCIEIVHAASTDAYRANPTDVALVKPAFDLLKNTDGMITLYHGLEIEDAKHVYVYILWDHIDHHKKLIADQVRYPILQQGTKAFFAAKAELFHVQPKSDPQPALQVPVTEFAKCTLKDLKDRAAVEKMLDELVVVTEGAKGRYGMTWGPIVEEEGSYVLLVGWESVQAHMNARNDFSEETNAMRKKLRELITIAGPTHSAQHRYL